MVVLVTHIMWFQLNRDVVAKHRTGRKLTWSEINAKYVARGMARAVLLEHQESTVSQWPDHTTKFVIMCRLLLDIKSRDYGGSRDIVDVNVGEVLKFEIDSTFCPAPERTTMLVPPPKTEDADGRVWIRAKWTELDYHACLLVDPDAWHIQAFSLPDDSDEGAALLSTMLLSALGKYADRGIPIPRSVAKFMDAARVRTDGSPRGLDMWTSGPEKLLSLKKSRLDARPHPKTKTS